jgi:hypothetical protein
MSQRVEDMPSHAKIRAPPLPTREDLKDELLAYEGMYCSPTRVKMRAVTIQIHHQNLSSYFEESSDLPTPNTKLFLHSGQQLVDFGSESVVDCRDNLLRQVAEAYLNRHHGKSTKKKPKVVEKSEESKPARATESKVATTRGADLFGGGFPKNDSLGFREVKTKWMMVERRIEHSYLSALARFGPMVRSCKAFVSKNGFRIYEFQCQAGKDCDYHARLYYPLGDEICHNFPSTILEETRNNKKRLPPPVPVKLKRGDPSTKLRTDTTMPLSLPGSK